MYRKIYTWNNYIEEFFGDGNISEIKLEFKSINNQPIMSEGIKKTGSHNLHG